MISTHVLSTGTCFFKKTVHILAPGVSKGSPYLPTLMFWNQAREIGSTDPLACWLLFHHQGRFGQQKQKVSQATHEPMVCIFIYLNIFHFSTFHSCNWSSQPDGPKSSRSPSFIEVHSGKMIQMDIVHGCVSNCRTPQSSGLEMVRI